MRWDHRACSQHLLYSALKLITVFGWCSPFSICHRLQVNDPGLKCTFAIEGACYITREEWSERHLAPVGLKRGLCILNSFILTKLSKLACIHLIIPMSKLIKLFLDLREKPGQTVCSSHYSDDRQMCNQHHRSHRHVPQWPGLFAIQQGWWVMVSFCFHII